MSNALASLQPADFAAGMTNLKPPGAALPNDPTSLFASLMAGISGRMAAAHARASLLSEVESDPRQTELLLPDWEASFGLPDPCLGLAPTVQQRRAQLLARIAGRGNNSSPAFYEAYAAALGYTITITQFQPFRTGESYPGEAINGAAQINTWQVNAPAQTVTYFRTGESAAGDNLETFNNTVLQCELQRLAPAHTTLVFNF